jgi:hypothetical protein
MTGYRLRAGDKLTGAEVLPDGRYPGMWRIHYEGRVSDMVNLSRAKDAARNLGAPGNGWSSSLHLKWEARKTVHGT